MTGTPIDPFTIQATDALRFEPGEATIIACTEMRVTLVAGRLTNMTSCSPAPSGTGWSTRVVMALAVEFLMGSGGLHVVHAAFGVMNSLTIMIETPGTFEAHCSVLGHREAGMGTVLEVVSAIGTTSEAEHDVWRATSAHHGPPIVPCRSGGRGPLTVVVGSDELLPRGTTIHRSPPGENGCLF